MELIGDHKIAFGKGKSGRVLFIDIGDLRGRRCLGFFTAKKVGKAEAYQGHVVLTSVTGQDSPEAFPVEFSVRDGDEKKAVAAGLTACAHVADRTLMPSWDGRSVVEFETLQDVTKKLRDFSGRANSDTSQRDPRVIRTSVPRDAFSVNKVDPADQNKILIPKTQEIGVRVGNPEPGFEAMAAARKVAAPASKVGYGPILAPDLDLDLAQSALSAVFQPGSLAVDFYGGAGLRRDNAEDTRFGDRAQAAKSFPILAELIANAPDIVKAIDARAPIQPLIIERTGLTKGALKRLSKITIPFDQTSVTGEERIVTMTDQLGANRESRFVVRGSLSLNQALDYLKDLPPDWVPDTNESWEAFADILGGLAIPLSHVMPGSSVKDLLSSSKGDWLSFKATLAKAADVPVAEFDRARMSAISGEVMMMIETFARTAILPMLANVLKRTGQSAVVQRNPDVINTGLERAINISPSIICGRAKSSMVALLEAERRYISRDTVIAAISMGIDEDEVRAKEARMSDKERQMGDMVGNKAFPVVRETWTASNGYQIIPFRNEEDMRVEGAFMHHCVGYFHAKNGSAGSYHYFSVRHPDTMGDAKQRGTLRILPISPGGEIKIGEFRSVHNSNVNAACMVAFQEWKNSFLQEDLDVAGQRMDEWREFRRVNGLDTSRTSRTPEDIWEGRIGVNIKNERAAELLWDEWAENVLSGWPAGNPEVLFRNAEIRELLSTFSPAAAEALIQEAEQKKAAETNAPSL